MNGTWAIILANSTPFGLNIFYFAFSVHIYIHEHITVHAFGLEPKQYAYRVLLPGNMLIGFFSHAMGL